MADIEANLDQPATGDTTPGDPSIPHPDSGDSRTLVITEQREPDMEGARTIQSMRQVEFDADLVVEGKRIPGASASAGLQFPGAVKQRTESNAIGLERWKPDSTTQGVSVQLRE